MVRDRGFCYPQVFTIRLIDFQRHTGGYYPLPPESQNPAPDCIKASGTRGQRSPTVPGNEIFPVAPVARIFAPNGFDQILIFIKDGEFQVDRRHDLVVNFDVSLIPSPLGEKRSVD